MARDSDAGPVRAEFAPVGAIGSRVGTYELVEYLGRGGMADVFAARCVAPRAPRGKVALKRMLPHLAQRRRCVELFLHEAKLATSLLHPNLVRGLDFGLADGIPFLVNEYVDGVSCDLLRRWSAGRGLPPSVALAIIHQLLSGLRYAHEARDRRGRPLGFVHQDISPDNVLVARTGLVKLADFGVARSILAEDEPGDELRGKLGYMAPEQAYGLQSGVQSDLFSVGVVLAELLLANHVFRGKSEFQVLVKAYNADLDALSDLDRCVSAELRQILHRALARNPADRFQSAEELDRVVCQAARQLELTIDSVEIVSWLAERGILETGSGVHEIVPASSRNPKRLQRKIETAGELARASCPGVDLNRDSASTTKDQSPALALVAGSPRYRIRSRESGEESWLTLAELLERLVTGRADGRTQVAADGAGFVPMGEVPPLAQIAKIPAYRHDDGLAQRAGWTSRLDRTRIPGVLFQQAAARTTGVLIASAGSRRKRIYFENGRPIFVASSDPTELIGARLLQLGVVSPRQLDQLVTLACFRGCRLGDELVAAKIVCPGEMLKLLVGQLESGVLELASWPDGELTFCAGVRPGVAAPHPLGPPSELACRMVRSRFCDAEIATITASLHDAPIARVPMPGSLATAVPLTETEARVIRSMAGSTEHEATIRRLSQSSGISGEDCRRSLFLGLSAGLLASPGWTEVAAPHSEPPRGPASSPEPNEVERETWRPIAEPRTGRTESS